MRWFRYYDDALNNPKVQNLPAPLFKAWVNILCLASKCGGNLPAMGDIAFALRMTLKQAEKAIADLLDARLIDRSGNALRPHDWDEMQYASDSSAERVKRHRDRKRNAPETPDVTLHETKGNGADTDTDTDTDTEKKKVSVGATEPRPRGTRFPHEAMPEAWKQFCTTERPDLDPSATYAICRDYWIAQPGQRGVKRDWDATWRNWVRNQKASLRPVEVVRDKAYWERLVNESR